MRLRLLSRPSTIGTSMIPGPLHFFRLNFAVGVGLPAGDGAGETAGDGAGNGAEVLVEASGITRRLASALEFMARASHILAQKSWCDFFCVSIVITAMPNPAAPPKQTGPKPKLTANARLPSSANVERVNLLARSVLHPKTRFEKAPGKTMRVSLVTSCPS